MVSVINIQDGYRRRRKANYPSPTGAEWVPQPSWFPIKFDVADHSFRTNIQSPGLMESKSGNWQFPLRVDHYFGHLPTRGALVCFILFCRQLSDSNFVTGWSSNQSICLDINCPWNWRATFERIRFYRGVGWKSEQCMPHLQVRLRENQ